MRTNEAVDLFNETLQQELDKLKEQYKDLSNDELKELLSRP